MEVGTSLLLAPIGVAFLAIALLLRYSFRVFRTHQILSELRPYIERTYHTDSPLCSTYIKKKQLLKYIINFGVCIFYDNCIEYCLTSCLSMTAFSHCQNSLKSAQLIAPPDPPRRIVQDERKLVEDY